MQKKIVFTGNNGASKEFVANVDKIDATPIGATTRQYLYAVRSVEIDNQIVGLDMDNGFTDPVSDQYFTAPDLN